jgi:hypothetical protein
MAFRKVAVSRRIHPTAKFRLGIVVAQTFDAVEKLLLIEVDRRVIAVSKSALCLHSRYRRKKSL